MRERRPAAFFGLVALLGIVACHRRSAPPSGMATGVQLHAEHYDFRDSLGLVK